MACTTAVTASAMEPILIPWPMRAGLGDKVSNTIVRIMQKNKAEAAAGSHPFVPLQAKNAGPTGQMKF